MLALTMAAGLVSAQTKADVPKFEVASIKLCAGDTGGGRGGGGGSSPGTLNIHCTTVSEMVQWAYHRFETGDETLSRPVPIEGAPAWMKSEQYRIEAKSEKPQGRGMMYGPMMQALLEERFKLRLHRESREVPVYLMTVAKGGPKLAPAKEGGCTSFDPENPPLKFAQGRPMFCGILTRAMSLTTHAWGVRVGGTTMTNLANQFSALVGRNVIDKTGISGTFDVRVEVPIDDLSVDPVPNGPTPGGPPPDLSEVIFTVARKLGLRLESGKGPGEFLVIDHVERPSEN